MSKIETNRYMRDSFPVSNDCTDQERYMHTNIGWKKDLLSVFHLHKIPKSGMVHVQVRYGI